MFGRILKKNPRHLAGLTLTLSRDIFFGRIYFSHSAASVVTFFLEPYRNAGAFPLLEFGFGNIALKLVNHSVDSGEPV